MDEEEGFQYLDNLTNSINQTIREFFIDKKLTNKEITVITLATLTGMLNDYLKELTKYNETI